MRRPFVGRLVSGLVTLALIIGAYLLFTFRQDVVDWWRLQSYKPSADVVALANSTTMYGRGRDLFYVSNPTVSSREEFNGTCTDTGEESLVLGCYKAQQIYIYDVSDARLNGVKEVTAAHEMLHAAYERLSGSERERVNALLEDQLAKITDARLNGLIDLYNKEEPGQLLNEMHSILGTEFSGLSADLESYYKQYFTDRSQVVGLANAYAAVFTDSQNRIDDYDKQLDELRGQIDSNTTLLESKLAAIESQSNQLDTLRTSDPAAYNAAVPGYNASVRAYNDLAARLRGLVAKYNELVNARNGEAAAQNDLYHSLDSNYESVGGS